MDSTKARIIKFLQYLSERNSKALISLFDDEVDCYIQGNTDEIPWIGKRSKKSEVKNFYEILWNETSEMEAILDHIFIEGNKAVITGGFSSIMTKTGNKFQSLFCIQIEIDNTKIIKYRLLEDSYGVSKALNLI